MHLVHAINSDRQTRLLNVLGQIAMILGDKKKSDRGHGSLCFVLSGRGLWDEPITHTGEPYRLWCVVCDLKTSRMRKPWPALARSAIEKKKIH